MIQYAVWPINHGFTIEFDVAKLLNKLHSSDVKYKKKTAIIHTRFC